MATELQHKALAKVIEYGRQGKRINKGKLLREVGYSGTTAVSPTKIFESKGFLDLCDQNGLSEDFLTKALFEDIRDKPKNRKPELELAFRVRGTLTPSEGGTKNNIFINNLIVDQQRRLAEEILAASEALPGSPD